MENYPGNSDRSKKEPERKKLEKVVSGEVKAKKGLSESFISGTPRNVVSNLLTDVLIPAAKKTIVDMVNNGISMLLYGRDWAREQILKSGFAHILSGLLRQPTPAV